MNPRIDEEYIGDGLYASHDNLQIWLRTDDNQSQNIALGRAAYVALVDYARRIGMDRLAPAGDPAPRSTVPSTLDRV